MTIFGNLWEKECPCMFLKMVHERVVIKTSMVFFLNVQEFWMIFLFHWLIFLNSDYYYI